MNQTLSAYLSESAEVLRAAATPSMDAEMTRAVALCVAALKGGKSVLVCGNGGSASDAMHITGELVGRFLKERKALRCICLADNPATLTAWANDYGYDSIFARQVEAYGEAGGVLIALSTSGNSKNVVQAAEKARHMGLGVLGLTGQGGGELAALCDVLLKASSAFTPHIQEAHLGFYHYLCAAIEAQMAAV
ncbi:MAG: SIS domain-containing protein [Alphaproteobacteria bacterium]|nr:SIS domain-containing protein [Alphaproteobacteria bacterium]